MIGLGFKLGKLQRVSLSQAATPPVANPLIWLDASQESFFNNDPVGQFTDRSGNGNHFTSSASARPTFKTNRINGLSTVQADGVDDGMLLSSLGAQSAWTLMYVGRAITTAARNIISIDDYGPDGAYILWQLDGANNAIINANPGAVNQCGAIAGTVYSYAVAGNSTSCIIRSSDGTNGSTSANFSKLAAPMRLFRRGDGQYANYEIAELLFYPSFLSSANRTTIWTYFNAKYGTPIPATV